MKGSFRFLLVVLLVTVLCAAAQKLWNMQAAEALRFPAGYFLLGFFSVTVTLIHLFLMSAAKGDGQAFVRRYLASTVMKFMFYILMLVFVLLLSKFDKRVLIVHFLFYYVVFTVLEVAFLYTELEKGKKQH
jgi:phosphoglycerol transferase MdoB-like AlkP superfamily enzyme